MHVRSTNWSSPPHTSPSSSSLQFFEGLALGSAAIQAGLATSKSVFVALTYSISTPVGTAIGELALCFESCGQP